MGEEQCTERLLETWPCGCRYWLIRTLISDDVTDENVERYEWCQDMQGLVKRAEQADRRLTNVYLEYGERSPEYGRALTAHEDAAARVEEHTVEMMPTVEKL